MIETTVSMNLMDALDNIRDAAVLWEQWAIEDGRDSVDSEAYVRDMVECVRGGQFCAVVARDGDTPVGMVQVLVFYDPATSTRAAHADKMFVAMDYRGEGVAHQLMHGCDVAARLMGATSATLPCDESMVGFYEKYGWTRYQVMMKHGDEQLVYGGNS